MYNKIIIDTNDLFKRCFSVIDTVNKTSKEIINEAVFRTVSMIISLKKKYLTNNGIVWVLADNATSKKKIRKELDPNYKANRIKESDGYYRGIDFVLLLLSKYSEDFCTARIKTYEADDLIKPIIDSLTSTEKVLLVSADMDWARGMNENIHWLSKSGLYDQESFKEKYKFYPNDKTVTLYKVFQGDSSDSIPPIEGINEQTTLNILNNFADVFDLLDTIKNNKEAKNLLSDYTIDTILRNQERIITNHQLIYFNFVSDEEMKLCTIKGSFNENALRILYESLDFPKTFDKRIEYKSVGSMDLLQFDDVKRK